MIADDEDDTHICLKCHTTITGLDNYVTHRKTGCRNVTANTTKLNTSSPMLAADAQDFLKADDFFSSLELQSSSKKPSTPPAATSKPNSGVLTRSKATAAIQAASSSSSKPSSLLSTKSSSQWIAEEQIREFCSNDDSQIAAAVDRIVVEPIKKDEPRRLDFEDSEEELDEYEEEDEDYDEDFHDAPPRSHTGGKWKPAGYPSRDSPLQWMRPPSREDWHAPPPHHTGGKWKPVPPTMHCDKSDEEDKNIPPPSHTKGKWMPGQNVDSSGRNISDTVSLRKSNGTVQYWCGPCNRRLASKIVYERHLKSELHFKRTLHEREFDETNVFADRPGVCKRKRNEESIENISKKSRKQFIKCDVCRSKVSSLTIGKHLISHYHCKRGNVTESVAQKMILQYIECIVQQAPFQCSQCSFFCNTEKTFLLHWNSVLHKDTSDKTSGYFYCIFCKFECKNTNEMLVHLLSEDHKEVILVINRSMPIVIKKLIPLRCGTCRKKFRYNFELRRHCLQDNHRLPETCSDEYQERHPCPSCELVLRSKISLQRHLKRHHGKATFFCTACSLTFDTYAECLQHKNTQKHRYVSQERRKEKGLAATVDKTCPHCETTFTSVMALKDHIYLEHSDKLVSCSQCGARFALPQEVSTHVRDKKCAVSGESSEEHKCPLCKFSTCSKAELLFHQVLHDKSSAVDGRFSCPICGRAFRKHSLRCHIRQHTGEKPFRCSQCDAGFARKSNLVAHRQQHSSRTAAQEAPPRPQSKKQRSFLCSTCGAAFYSKNALQQHMKLHTGKEVACPHSGCPYRARTAAELRHHESTHSDVRPYPCLQCKYRGKTKALLNKHSFVHVGSKKLSCPHCSFTCNLKHQLRRHSRIHTGAKPFCCPHCSYSCNCLGNLRKHVLNTVKHPGKCLYECKLCAGNNQPKYATNFARDFQVHLLNEHPGNFPNARQAGSYVAGIYQAEADPKNVLFPVDTKEKESKNSKKPAGKKKATKKSAKEIEGDAVEKPSTAEVTGSSASIFPNVYVLAPPVVSIEAQPSDQLLPLDVVFVEMDENWSVLNEETNFQVNADAFEQEFGENLDQDSFPSE